MPIEIKLWAVTHHFSVEKGSRFRQLSSPDPNPHTATYLETVWAIVEVREVPVGISDTERENQNVCIVSAHGYKEYS